MASVVSGAAPERVSTTESSMSNDAPSSLRVAGSSLPDASGPTCVSAYVLGLPFAAAHTTTR